MFKPRFRKYNSLLAETKPLIMGEIANCKNLSKGIRFNLVAPNGHVLTNKEVAEVIGDNMLSFSLKRKRGSQYNISDLNFVEIVEDKEGI